MTRMKPARRAWTVAIGIAATCVAIACTPVRAYTESDAATYDVIGAEYRRYVESDTRLTPAQKARRYRTLDSWRLRIDATLTEGEQR